MREAAVGVIMFLVLILAGVPLTRQPASGEHSLTAKQILNTGPFRCTGEQQEAYWTNETGGAIHVRKAQIWQGMYAGGVSDFWFWLIREGDETVLGHTNWDHYADPTEQHAMVYTYAPDYILIPAGDGVILRAGCTNINDRPNLKGHVTVTLWWY